ncbi:MAG: ribosomal-processing cysteine protease Prp [Clostridia bacterium]|nr:ribosomal-processing cysteine protease Prp [Clostridia bacterium]
MITASFRTKNGSFCGFTVKGHSGYSEQGSDIICAAVSSMVNLTVRLLQIEKTDFSFSASPEIPQTVLDLNSVTDPAHNALNGLYCELCELAAEYKGFVKTKKQEIK